MRNTFINELIDIAQKDKNIFLLVGDLGFSVVEPFAEKYPDRFLNCGVAEQNMTGIAAGLAIEGYKVFTYSIANFNTLRCLEQIRNDICYHNLDVTVVSVGGGLSYGNLGYSHHAIQDIAIMGSMPNISLLLPGDPIETKWCVEYAIENKNPKYLRLGKAGEKNIHCEKDTFSRISCLFADENSDVAIVSTSNMLDTANKVRDEIAKEGINASLYSVLIIDSCFNDEIKKISQKNKYIFTIEEHLEVLGFGSIVKKSLELENSKVISFGIAHSLNKEVGSQNYLRDIAGLNSKYLSRKIVTIYNKEKRCN